MPRSARVTYPGGFYHIYNRGINKERIFRHKSDYIKVLSIFSKLVSVGDWIVYAYSFMPNHYHLLVEERRMPIAKLIGRLFTSYSLNFNKKYHRCGTLFQDRFKSKLVQKDPYFLEVSRYIHCNSVYAGLVRDPLNYPYSSLQEYVGIRPATIIHQEKVTKLIDDAGHNIESYIAFVKAGIKRDLEEFNPFHTTKEILGNRIFTTHRKWKIKK